MFCSDCHALLFGCRNEGSSGQVICLSEQAPGALVDSGDGGLIKEVFLHPCNGQVVSEILLHVLSADSLEVASCHNPGGKGLRGAVSEFIDQDGLTCQDNREIRFGVYFKLGKGMQLLKDIEAEQ